LTRDPLEDIVIGEIVSTFGIRGEVKVRPDTDYPERLLRLKAANLLMRDGSHKTLDIENIRFHKGVALFKFAGCNDLTTAEGLRGSFLVISESELIELPEDEYFIHDLEGLQVYTTDGRDLGKLTQVIKGPANDAYVTTKTIIPALKSVVKQVNLEERKMIVDMPEADSE
jgi:16S rRNA processing protein RimM